MPVDSVLVGVGVSVVDAEGNTQTNYHVEPYRDYKDGTDIVTAAIPFAVADTLFGMVELSYPLTIEVHSAKILDEYESAVAELSEVAAA